MGNLRNLIGTKFPDFDLATNTDVNLTLSDLIGKWSVFFFYPKDSSYGCTKQSCKFRDDYFHFRELGVQIIGVSADSANSHKRFATRHNLPYTLLSDKSGALRKELNIPKTLGFLPGRTTFIVDPEGIIRKIYNSQIMFKRHSKNALSYLRGVITQ